MLLHLVSSSTGRRGQARPRGCTPARCAGLQTLRRRDRAEGWRGARALAAIVTIPASPITFPDRAALDAYQKNDRHVPVAHTASASARTS